MLEEDRTTICGPRYQHQADRQASRTGSVQGEVALGGRKVAIRRPRVRANGPSTICPPRDRRNGNRVGDIDVF
jgi:hypothetical protein